MTKTIQTLLQDIHQLFNPDSHHAVNEDNLKTFLESIAQTLRDALSVDERRKQEAVLLRLSRTGVPLRRLAYEARQLKSAPAGFNPGYDGPKYIKFLQGHLAEALLLFLAQEAGHTVEHQQKEVTLNGVVGHIDAVIDGHLVDVKTASHFAFAKFKEEGRLVEGKDDPFGYRAQIASYQEALEKELDIKTPPFFWAYNKSDSEMVIVPAPREHLPNAGELLTAQQKVVETLPDPASLELCYPDEPFGKGGNMQVNKQCTFCPFLNSCRGGGGPGVRKFKYSDGVKYLTTVVSEPKVEEIK